MEENSGVKTRMFPFVSPRASARVAPAPSWDGSIPIKSSSTANIALLVRAAPPPPQLEVAGKDVIGPTYRRASAVVDVPPGMAILLSTPRNRKQVIGFWVVAVIALLLSLGLGTALMGRLYNPNVAAGTDPYNGRVTRSQLVGIYLLTFLGTLSVMMFANAIPSLVVFGWSRTKITIILLFLMLSFIVGLVLMVVYMWEPQKTYTDAPAVASNDQALIAVGSFFFVGFGFLALMIGGILWELFPKQVNSACARVMAHMPGWFVRMHWRRRVVAWMTFIIILGLSVPTFSPALFDLDGTVTTEGEYLQSPSSDMWNWVWTDRFVVTWSQECVIFYGFAIFILAATLLVRSDPRYRSAMHHRIWAPSESLRRTRFFRWHPFPSGISRGEVLVMTWLVVLMGLWVLIWIQLNPTMVKIIRSKAVEFIDLIIFARVMGHLSSLMFSFVLLPVTRTGLWVDIFGVPYERALKFHRLTGALAFFLVSIHAIVNYIKWAIDGTLANNIVEYDKLEVTAYYIIYTNFSITIIELAYFLMAISIAMAVIMRRRLYAVFLYSHKYIGIIFYVACLIHATNFWYTNVPGMVLWLCDKWVRGVAASRCFVPTELSWHERNRTTMIKLSSDSLPGYKPGQYFFINIPCISLNEWHPFTASAVLDDGIVLYIKNMQRKNGGESWTSKLADFACSPNPALPVMRLSGPFGHISFESYETILLFAGGIGITPMIAIFAGLRKRMIELEEVDKIAERNGLPKTTKQHKRVRLMWMSRSVSEFRLFETIFSLFVRSDAIKFPSSLRASDAFGHMSEAIDENKDESSTDNLDESELHAALRRSSMADSYSATQQPEASNPCTLNPNPDTDKLGIGKKSNSSASQHDGQVACTFDIQLHCTRRESFVSLTDPKSPDYVSMFIRNGRCNIREVFENFATPDNTTMAAVCGPPELMASVSSEAYKFNTAFHAETFFF